MSSKKQFRRSKGSKSNLSKRQTLRAERKKKEVQRRILIIGSILVVVLVITGLIIIPSNQNINEQVNNIFEITPQNYQTADGKSIGNPDAVIKIQLFEDFKCSACLGYQQNIEPLIIEELAEKGRILYTFHHFPFMDDQTAFKDSDNAALASECAAEQNRFWDYKDILFANMNFIQGEFSDEKMLAMAKSLNLDQKEFEACYIEGRYLDKINADIQLSRDLNIAGTPTLLINGENISPGRVPTFDQILEKVEEIEASQ
jgi:protein-disulfide isomerase